MFVAIIGETRMIVSVVRQLVQAWRSPVGMIILLGMRRHYGILLTDSVRRLGAVT